MVEGQSTKIRTPNRDCLKNRRIQRNCRAKAKSCYG